jgi:ADP-ribosylglycohydrolase
MTISAAWVSQMNEEDLLTLLRAEIQQSRQEGRILGEDGEIPWPVPSTQALVEQYLRLISAPIQEGFPYVEPDSLEEIRTARPQGSRTVTLNFDPDSLYDRIHGGWLGRVAGCVLGKPVEPWCLKHTIDDYLKLAEGYPLANYIPRLDPFPSGNYPNISGTGVCLDEIHGAPQDDDTDYTVLGLHLLETHGFGLKTSAVAAAWLDHLPYTRTWTAERAAYRNLILGIPAEAAAGLLNPEREFIGARIRADIYGLASPGRPAQAAALAWQDAALSHTRNGIYSAMFMAAMTAWAFVTTDIEVIIQAGLAEIPRKCRLAEGIRELLALHHEGGDWESLYERMLPAQAACHPVHAINNTLWMVLALLHGNGDFEKTICTAVMCGFDTDCNGANAGTIAGILAGARGLPSKWIDPLEDTLHTAVAGFSELRISELSRRTTALAEKNLSSLRQE